MTTTEFTGHSVYGMTCEQCGKGLIAPELSECVSEMHVRHIWHCINCNAEFEMSSHLPTDTNPKISDEEMRKVFLSRLTA